MVGGEVAADVRVADPDPAPLSAALAAASLRAALSFRAASSRVFLAQAARSAVVWASVAFVLSGVVSILSPLFIPPAEGGLGECTCTMDYLF
jgi:hypothetical protein